MNRLSAVFWYCGDMRFVPDEYTVEAVTPGHPDKVCDQIADAILDAYLEADPASRVAVEVMGSHGVLTIGGEVSSSADIDVQSLALAVYQDIGYDDELSVRVEMAKQSPEIATGIAGGGAGDQGIMYGYATGETEQMLPQGVVLAHTITGSLTKLRDELDWLAPDGKAQVTMRDGALDTVLVSVQHSDAIGAKAVAEMLERDVLAELLGLTDSTNIIVNPAGDWTVGGFLADAGVTGRKIMVDTYGGLIMHGGGAFSGKDPTKVDRSAAYMARFAAKNLVAQGLGGEVLVSVAYAIGMSEPLMLRAENERGEDISEALTQQFDFRPEAIIEQLNLRRPIYRETARHGHFGNPAFPWETILQR